MPGKVNCWEFKKCGRERNGEKIDDLGTCPAATNIKLNNVHSGRNGGRCCWAVAGTLCGGRVQGIFAYKLDNCEKCDFYQLVHMEEGKDIQPPSRIIEKIHRI